MKKSVKRAETSRTPKSSIEEEGQKKERTDFTLPFGSKALNQAAEVKKRKLAKSEDETPQYVEIPGLDKSVKEISEAGAENPSSSRGDLANQRTFRGMPPIPRQPSSEESPE